MTNDNKKLIRSALYTIAEAVALKLSEIGDLSTESVKGVINEIISNSVQEGNIVPKVIPEVQLAKFSADKDLARSFVGYVKSFTSANKVKISKKWEIAIALKGVFLGTADPEIEGLLSESDKIVDGVTSKISGVLVGYFAKFDVNTAAVMSVFSEVEESIRKSLLDLITKVMKDVFPDLAKRTDRSGQQ